MNARLLSVVVALLAVFAMAPTVGDTGSCGRTATELDRERYANARKLADCRRCTECGIATSRCGRACDAQALAELLLPSTCRPLYRDGEVCLRALSAASCDTFATYVDDEAPVNPSECDFCRQPAPTSSFADGAAGEATP